LVVRDTHALAAPALVIRIPRKLVAGCREPLRLKGLLFTPFLFSLLLFFTR